MAKALLEAKQEALYQEQNDPSRMSVFYTQCQTCLHEVETIVNSWEMSDKLFNIYDLTGMEYWNSYFQGANLCLTVCCDNCKTEFEDIVYVTGNPIWNYEEIDEGRVPQVESFVGCEVKCLSGTKDTSLQQCFINDNMYSEDIDLAPNVATNVKLTKNVIIIAKTRMNSGFCYLGLDVSTIRILRPIQTTIAGHCCWSSKQNMSLKNQYTFKVTHYPNDDTALTQYPHCLEDMVVLPDPVVQHYSVNLGPIRSIAHTDVTELFKGIEGGRYVLENTNTPSAGVISCSTTNLQILPQDGRADRCILNLPSGTYNFPMKAIEYDDIINRDQNAYVVLGLGRPFANFKPARCYILVTGIHVLDI